jgi:arylsulfatase A-like enzyme
VKFIEANKATPFFLYFANTMPHVPLFVSDDRFDPDPRLAYKLTIEHIDWSVGQMLKALEEHGIADNTLIVYTSDNGPWLSKQHHGGCALPLRAGKGTTYEGGMREPTVMRWPARIKPGQTCSQVAGTIDLLPTFAAIVGAELDDDRPIDGLDISRLLDDPEAESPHDEAGYYYYKNGRPEAIRLGKWKLHLKKTPELYDLRADIGESNNVAEANADVVAKLRDTAAKYDADLKANSRPLWRGGVKKK